jgi:hypothetical protein
LGMKKVGTLKFQSWSFQSSAVRFHTWRCNRWRDATAESTDWVKTARPSQKWRASCASTNSSPFFAVKNHSRRWYPVPR